MEPAADGSTKRSITACDRCKEKKRKCIVTNEGQGCDVGRGFCEALVVV